MPYKDKTKMYAAQKRYRDRVKQHRDLCNTTWCYAPCPDFDNCTKVIKEKLERLIGDKK